MINNSFDLFSAEVHFILKHLEIIKFQEKHIQELGRKASVNKTDIEKNYLGTYSTYRIEEKQMAYSSNVIFLYGIFEQFIESSIKEYIEDICSFMTSFDMHDEVIKNNYFELWMKMQTKLDWAKFSGLNQHIMNKNLYDTIYDGKQNIMYQCYLKNGGNYNHDKVSEAITSITGRNFREEILKYNPIRRFFIRSGAKTSNSTTLLKVLDEFVEARNDIAHNGRPANMLGETEFRKTIHFILSYAKSLTMFLNDNILRKKWEVLSTNSSNFIFKSLHYWSRIKTSSFESDNVIVYKNQEVIVKQPQNLHPQYIIVRIEEIHHKLSDGSIKEVEDIVSDNFEEFSIKFSDKISPKSEIIPL